MVTPPDQTTANPYAVIAALRSERDAALAEKAELAKTLSQRNSDYGERIEQQSAIIDVLKVLSASPGDPQPVFDLIVERARTCCGAELAALSLIDGDLLHLHATSGMTAARTKEFSAAYPLPVSQAFAGGRAILLRDTVQVPDTQVDPDFAQRGTNAWHRSVLAVPLLCSGLPIGAIGLSCSTPGTFSAAQVELLKTFAEQAVIAITSAETYRALQKRTTDLQQSLEYQTATSAVLKVISRSTFDLQPVLDTVAETAARLCDAEQAAIFRREGELWRLAANFGFPPEFEADWRELGAIPFDSYSPAAGWRTVRERRPVHIHDAAAVPGYLDTVGARQGKQRTTLGVPLLREGDAIGNIVLARQRVEPFTERQIDLASTFADQAVIAIENIRLLTEQREALEQQIATAEILQVINSSPGNLKPVFDAMLEKATDLCAAALGILWTFDGQRFYATALRNVSRAYAEFLRDPVSITSQTPLGRIAAGETFVHIADLATEEFNGAGGELVRHAVELDDVRTVLTMPLRKEGALLGAFSIYRQERRLFTDKQIALLQNFAAQAVIAMENARLLTETREALEQQTATAEVLQVINSSPGDLKPVFDAMLEKALSLCEASFGIMNTYEGERVLRVAERGLTPAYTKWREANPLGSSSAGIPVALQRLIAGERAVNIVDVRTSELYHAGNPNTRALVDLAGARTHLAVALRRGHTVCGMFTIFRQEVRPFSDKHIALLQNFAAQAVIAMENARLLTETREALEQQTATAEVLQVINSSPGDLAPVFDAMLEKAIRICEATHGHLFTYDGDRFHAVAIRGDPRYIEWQSQDGPVRPGPMSPLGRIGRGEQIVHIADVREEEVYRTVPGFKQQADTRGVRSQITVALLKDDSLLGAMVIYRQEVRPFSDKQIALLQNFAAQAVIAMENARLITETREALQQQTATAEVLGVINSSPGNLAPVFDAMLEKATALCEAPFGIMQTYDGERFQPAASYGVPAPLAEFLANDPLQPGPQTGLGRLASGADLVHITDLADPSETGAGDPRRQRLLVLGGVRTYVVVALRKDGRLLGAIGAYRQEVRPFSDKQVALLQNFAAQAVIAMENARLITETREALEQQTATSEILGVISRSPSDIRPVFDAIVARAAGLCEAEFSIVARFEEDGLLHLVALNNMSAEESAALHSLFPRLPERDFTLGRAFVDARPVHLADVPTDRDYEPRAIEVLQSVAGYRSVLAAPIFREGRPIGVVGCGRRAVKPFAPIQIALLETFADQAGIALGNARLFNELRERTDELARRQAELRVTFDNMGDGVAMFDKEQRLTAWNRNFLELLELPDDFLTRRPSFAEYFHYLAGRGEYVSADLEAELSRFVEDTEREMRFERTRPDGRIIEVRRNAVQGGGFVLIYSDITERKHSEAEIRAARDAAEAAYRDLKAAQASLIQAEKMASLGQVTAGIAHEIKNPLNFVNNFADLSADLLDELHNALAGNLQGEIDELTATLKSNLAKITEHGKRADSIVKNMLLHSRSGPSEHRLIDLNSVVEEALNLAYHGARAETSGFSITIDKQLDPAAGMVEIYPQEITRVILNLISNGFYAARKRVAAANTAFEPMLRLATRDLDSQVEILVRDNGIGISDEVRGKIFEPFFTTKPAGEGTGLGLSLSYDIIVKQHGGQLSVDSRPNEFTEFRITLPRSLAANEGRA